MSKTREQKKLEKEKEKALRAYYGDYVEEKGFYYRLPQDIREQIEVQTGPCEAWKTRTGLLIIKTINDGLIHLSLSHNNRLPSYFEMKKARYDLAPEAKYMAQIFPPESEFVNVHPNCLHLYEMQNSEIGK